jgi:hypothetical protein
VQQSRARRLPQGLQEGETKLTPAGKAILVSPRLFRWTWCSVTSTRRRASSCRFSPE